MDWCRLAGVHEQASNKLWNVKILVPKRGEYPEVSSKVMKGAACRFMVHWCAHESLHRAELANDQHSWLLGFPRSHVAGQVGCWRFLGFERDATDCG